MHTKNVVLLFLLFIYQIRFSSPFRTVAFNNQKKFSQKILPKKYQCNEVKIKIYCGRNANSDSQDGCNSYRSLKNTKLLTNVNNFLKTISIKWTNTLLVSLSGILMLRPKLAWASIASIKKFQNVDGYDLYGRVPLDDWLFSTWRLTDPNLLKRSYVECVSTYYLLLYWNILT